MERPDRLGVGREGVADERARDDDAEDGDADQPGDARDRVVDGGGDAGVALVGVGEDCRRERGDGERETDREDQQPR